MANLGGKIDCFIDVVSPYSYFALLYLCKNRDTLRSYGVEIEFIPIFLGGVNVGSGNKPPWTLPAKATYGRYDFIRGRQYFGVPDIKSPPFFPILSLLPQRALCYIKAHHPQTTYESAFRALFHHLWSLGLDISTPEHLRTALSTIFPNADEVDRIITAAGQPEWKERLNANTKIALERGAFGAPWCWVTRGDGKAEPFFGSDRWGFMWEFLGVGWRDLVVLVKGERGEAKL